jgi:cysteine sulfinate desulfinase/cysteine desulfurase-like protein
MVDGVQALGKLPLRLSQTRIDYAPFSGHKLYAPKGIGLLYVREGAPFTPLLAGGGQEGSLRSGTENLAGAVALAEALRIRQGEDAPAERERRATLRDDLEQRLALPVAGGAAQRLPGHALLLTAYRGDTVVRLLDERDIAVSAGSACASGDPQPDPVLGAMGIDQAFARGAVRVTLGPTTTPEEIDALVAAWAEIEQGLDAAREASA